MTTLTARALCLTAGAAVWMMAAVAPAQIPTAGSATGLNSAFLKLFEGTPAFTAKAETQVFDATQKETVKMPIEWSALDGKVRLEVDLERVAGKDMTPATLAALKQAGMSRVVSVYRPDKKATYVMYPGVQSYVEIPLDKGEVEALQKGLKLEKTPLGKESIDGHSCVKNKTTVKGEKGAVLQLTTWNATDLKDFPVQVEMQDKRDTIRMRFTQVKAARVDGKLFELPANYRLMK